MTFAHKLLFSGVKEPHAFIMLKRVYEGECYMHALSALICVSETIVCVENLCWKVCMMVSGNRLL